MSNEGAPKQKTENDVVAEFYDNDAERLTFQGAIRQIVATEGIKLGASIKDYMEACEYLYELTGHDASKVTPEAARAAFRRYPITRMPK